MEEGRATLVFVHNQANHRIINTLHQPTKNTIQFAVVKTGRLLVYILNRCHARKQALTPPSRCHASNSLSFSLSSFHNHKFKASNHYHNHHQLIQQLQPIINTIDKLYTVFEHLSYFSNKLFFIEIFSFFFSSSTFSIFNAIW